MGTESATLRPGSGFGATSDGATDDVSGQRQEDVGGRDQDGPVNQPAKTPGFEGGPRQMGQGHRTRTPLHGEEGRSQQVCRLDTRQSLPTAPAALAAVSPDTNGRSETSCRRSRKGASYLAMREERQGWKPLLSSTHRGTSDRCLRQEGPLDRKEPARYDSHISINGYVNVMAGVRAGAQESAWQGRLQKGR